MATHRRSTSDSTTTIFVPHALSFAGAGEEEDKYHAAQRYDWDDVPLKLTEPRAPYELTQPFDYVVPKKAKKSQALGANNANVNGEAEVGVVRKKLGRPRKDAALAVAEENTSAHSVEPDGTRSQPKRRGRPPRRSEASRKTDDGDNTADESYVQPGETWKAGTKRRGPAPPHPPTKKPRISKTAETDDEQETAPLRSGGARSRVTPLKPQQANRWSNVEARILLQPSTPQPTNRLHRPQDRQLIDSLFEVLGSIPWRRVTAYMAERGYPCADRGEGAIRGRWKVLRPRLYIVPPPVVRGAAAKSQMKARERETVGREEGEGGAEEEDDDGEADAEGEDAVEGEMEVDPKEPERQQPGEEHGPDMAVDVEGDTTVEEDEVPPPPPRKPAVPEKQQNTPKAPASVLPGNQKPNAPSAPQSDGGVRTSEPRGEVPPAPSRPTVNNTSPNPPIPPNLPHTSPNPPPFALPNQTLLRSPAARIANPPIPQSPGIARKDLPAPSQSYTSPIPNHRSLPREPRFYAHPSATSRLSEHPAFQSDSPFTAPAHSPKALSPIRHLPSPDRPTLPPLPSQLLSPTHRLPHGYPNHLAEDRHLPHPQEGPLLSSPGSRHLTQPPPLPLPQQFSPAPVWPARAERVYDDNPFDEQSRTRPERGLHTSGERGYSTSPERTYPGSAERDRHHTSPGREYQTSSERERYTYEGTRPRKGRKPEMLPFPVTHPTRQRETANTGTFSTFSANAPATFQSSFQTSPFQAQSQGSPYQASSQASQVFPPPPLYGGPLFTTQELAPSGSRLPVLSERTPPRPAREPSSRKARGAEAAARRDAQRKLVDEPRRTRQATYERQSSSQGSGLSEVPDSTAGDSDL